MTRRPVPIALAVVAAIVILIGRVNHQSSWGDWVVIAGFALLVIAAILNFVPRR
jgi:hypothetical protein